MLVLGLLVVLAATFLAGVVGFAYGLVALPALLLVGVPLDVVVVVNLLVGLVSRVGVVLRHGRRIETAATALLVAGSLPGMALGLLVREAVPARAVELAAGAMTVVAVLALSRPATRAPSTRWFPAAALTAGGVGGLLGVTTSLNGVPPALLLMRRAGSATGVVANLAAYFVVGNTLTVALLVLGPGADLRPALPLLAAWLPAGVLGQAVGVAVGARLPQPLFRRLVLGVALVSGLASVLQAL